MSGTPKYCQAELQARQREALERDRKRKAAEEERRRKEAEARERQRQLENARKRIEQEYQGLVQALAQRKTQMHAADSSTIHQAAAEISADVARATNLEELNRANERIVAALNKVQRAIARKRQDDELQKLHRELDRLKAKGVELQHELDSQREAGLKFDADGRKAAATALKRVFDAVASSQPDNARTAFDLATKAIASHQDLVGRRQREHERKRFEAQAAAGELEVLIAGIRSDPVAMRWQEKAINELAPEVNRAHAAISAERFEVPGATLARARDEVQKLVSEANQAQLKADRRDYIARSIVDALRAMSFEVSAPVDTHPGHPLSPLEVHAADSLNRHLYVSIPVEGNMMYTVDGFPMSGGIAADGSETSACDAAERVLVDMQERLDAASGISTGEIWWEGKDPNRNLRTSKPLDHPKSSSRGH